ncbi:hypothetical protein EYC84_003122 [Monilinia fructicola]|uniref:Uncharacterized protein n=1 Tax=Monilinia fructicola TaxID=38448 RepID=A0A5M9JX92_MONFR|nr:hypothetical protein EYC84_003122 [Monilinia fructicola]
MTYPEAPTRHVTRLKRMGAFVGTAPNPEFNQCHSRHLRLDSKGYRHITAASYIHGHFDALLAPILSNKIIKFTPMKKYRYQVSTDIGRNGYPKSTTPSPSVCREAS